MELVKQTALAAFGTVSLLGFNKSSFTQIVERTPDARKYEYLPFPEADIWGVVTPQDAPLAKKKAVTVDDLVGRPLFSSEQGWKNDIAKWCGERIHDLRLEGSFRLAYNASVFVKEQDSTAVPNLAQSSNLSARNLVGVYFQKKKLKSAPMLITRISLSENAERLILWAFIIINT